MEAKSLSKILLLILEHIKLINERINRLKEKTPLIEGQNYKNVKHHGKREAVINEMSVELLRDSNKSSEEAFLRRYIGLLLSEVYLLNRSFWDMSFERVETAEGAFSSDIVNDVIRDFYTIKSSAQDEIAEIKESFDCELVAEDAPRLIRRFNTLYQLLSRLNRRLEESHASLKKRTEKSIEDEKKKLQDEEEKQNDNLEKRHKSKREKWALKFAIFTAVILLWNAIFNSFIKTDKANKDDDKERPVDVKPPEQTVQDIIDSIKPKNNRSILFSENYTL